MKNNVGKCKYLQVMKIFIAVVVLEVLSLNVAFVYTLTSPEYLLGSNSTLQEYFIEELGDIPEALSDGFLEVIVDMSYSALFSLKLKDFCNEKEFAYIQGYYSASPEVQLAYSPSSEIESFSSLLSVLQIKTWAVIYSTDFFQAYSTFILSASEKLPISPSTSPNQLLHHLNELKFSQVNTIILLLPPTTSALILQLCSTPDFTGYIWILSSQSDYLPYSSQSIYEQQGVVRLSITHGEYWPQYIAKSIGKCGKNFEICIRENFEFVGNRIKPEFFVLNVVQGDYVEVGVCDTDCRITREIVWPDGVYDVQSTQKQVKMSYEASLYDPVGNYLAFLAPAYQGIEFGLKYSSNLTSQFSLVPTALNLGGIYFNQSYVKTELDLQRSNLGIATIAPAMSDLAVGLYQTLQNDSIHLPMIGYSNTITLLTSTIEFSMYTRVCMPDTYLTYIIALMVKYFDWSKVGVVYIDNIFSTSLYNEFFNIAVEQNIEIVNKAFNRLPGNSGTWTNKDLDPVLKVLGNSGARIIVVLCYTNEIDKILVRMHELDYYGSEYEYIAVGWLVDELVNPSSPFNETRQEIIRKALTGSLMFFPVSFINDFGKEIQQKYYEEYQTQPVGYTSFGFDAVLSLTSALDLSLFLKKDYTDPFTFMQTLRSVKFQGTTGIVTFQERKNDRSPMDHYIVNTKKINDSYWEVTNIGLFSPTSINVFTFYENITWPGDSVPSDSPPVELCPFASDSVKYTQSGTAILIVLLFCVFSITLISMFIGWKRWKFVKVLMIEEKRFELTFYDMIGLLRILSEFFQYIGLIPTLPVILKLFKLIGNACSLDLEVIYMLNPKVYWHIYQLVLASTGLLMFLRVLHRFKLNIPYFRVFMCFSGDILYISTISTLLNIYLCQQSSNKPFLQYDCFTVCWQSLHLAYIFINSLVLLAYCFIVVIEKPKWNIASSDEQRLLMSPKQMYVRSGIQCFLVCLKKIIWLIGPIGYSIVLIIVFTLYSAFSVKIKPYNVEIVNLWNSLALIALICIAVVSLLCEVLNAQTSPIWLIVVLAVWGGLALFGLFFQKHQKLVWPFITGKNNPTLLRFAFHRATIDELRKSREIPDDMTFRPNEIIPPVLSE